MDPIVQKIVDDWKCVLGDGYQPSTMMYEVGNGLSYGLHSIGDENDLEFPYALSKHAQAILFRIFRQLLYWICCTPLTFLEMQEELPRTAETRFLFRSNQLFYLWEDLFVLREQINHRKLDPAVVYAYIAKRLQL